MTLRNKMLGKKGEDFSADHLCRRGYEILARNVRTPFGELDLVAAHDGCTVFIEVKTRRSRTHGSPEEAVTARKRNRLLQSALYYLQQRGNPETPWRIDVVAVECDRSGRVLRIEVHENAVFASSR
jgi:putative endonuclease